jgi:hypothetical protein
MEGICNLGSNLIMLDFIQFRTSIKVKMKEIKANFPGLTGKLAPNPMRRTKVGTHG